MRVSLLANSSWYLRNFRTSTIEALSQAAHVVCIAPGIKKDASFDRHGATSVDFFLEPSSTNPINEFRSFFSLLLAILKSRSRIVFSFNPKTNLYALILCWLFRVHCVANVSGVGVASQLGGVKGVLYNSLGKFFYRRAAYVFFQNQDDYQAFADLRWVDSRRAEVLPGSGVDLDRFKSDDKCSDKLRFLMAVRLIKPKGVEEYLEAARRVLLDGADCEFLLAGINDTSSRAVDQFILDALESEPNIHFLGHVKDMPELLKTVDCVVLPSYYPEGVPRNLIEAAAAGKVIITTDMPGCREVVIHEENGYLVEARSVDQLANAMQKVLELPVESRRNMQRSSRALAESRFDEQIVIRRYLEVAEQLTGHPFTNSPQA